jgi:hypothetical protein
MIIKGKCFSEHKSYIKKIEYGHHTIRLEVKLNIRNEPIPIHVLRINTYNSLGFYDYGEAKEVTGVTMVEEANNLIEKVKDFIDKNHKEVLTETDKQLLDLGFRLKRHDEDVY